MILTNVAFGDEVTVRIRPMLLPPNRFWVGIRGPVGGYISWVSYIEPAYVPTALGIAAVVEDSTFVYTLAVDNEMIDLGLKGWVMDFLGLPEVLL